MIRTLLSFMFFILPVVVSAMPVEAPRFSLSAGFYPSALEVALTTPTEGADIRYTLDGSEPSSGSFLYQGTISLDTTCVIRARAFRAGSEPSPVVTQTFFIGEDPALNDLPVVSLSTDPSHLWDPETGIYANPLERGDEWERPVTVEYFEQGGTLGFCENAGIRVHGGASRLPSKSAKKSFRLYFRSTYGVSKLAYPIIRSSAFERYDRLVLRAGYNDAWIHWHEQERRLATYIRDSLVRELFIAMGQPASHGDFVHLFLNGAYWGLYNVSERYDDDFGDAYLGRGDWDIVKPGPDETGNAIEAVEGDLTAWNRFASWFRSRDFRAASDYDELQSWVDLDNLIDFYILNLFTQNWDWPRHNWYAIRNRNNGRWFFVPWDSECTFGTGTEGYRDAMNMIRIIADQSNYPFPAFLHALKRNAAFRRDVAARWNTLIATHLHPDRTLVLLERLVDRIRTAIPFEAARWGNARPPDTYSHLDWLTAVESIRVFLRRRSAIVTSHLQSEGFFQTSTGIEATFRESTPGILLSNHPNPFNASTTIRFETRNGIPLGLMIFDSNGRVVFSWKPMGEGGCQGEVHVEASWLPSGIYFCLLETTNGSKTVKMVCIR